MKLKNKNDENVYIAFQINVRTYISISIKPFQNRIKNFIIITYFFEVLTINKDVQWKEKMTGSV